MLTTTTGRSVRFGSHPVRNSLVALLTAALSAAPLHIAVAQSGPVAAYGFNETTGNSVIDAAGGNTGTFGTGVAHSASGKFGGALSFTGGWVTIPNSAALQLKTAMTLEAWIKPTTITQTWRDVIYKGNDNYYLMATTDFSKRPAGGGTIGSPSGTTEAYATANLVANTWVHVATTYDGASLKMYVNGVLVSTVARTGTILTSANALSIGGDAFWTQNFSGFIDEVRIYDRALSIGEVQTDMNTPVGGTPPADTQAPAIAITAPTGTGSYTTTGSTLTVSGTASDNVGVTGVTWTNDRGGSGTATGTTSWSAAGIALQSGINVITVTARDAANNATPTTLTVTMNPPDTQAPTVAITTPSGTGSYTTTATTLAVGGTSSDNLGVTSVTWTNSRGGSGTATGTTSWSVPTIPLQSGTNVITVTAKDAANNVGTATLTVTANVPDTQAPAIAITAPTGSGAWLTNSSSVTVSGTASDNVGVTTVTWTSDRGGSGTASGTTSWSATGIALQPGANVITVTANDAATNATPAVLTVTVDQTVPTVAVTAPSAGATVSGSSVTVSATATDDRTMAGVTLLIDGVATGSEVAGGGPSFTLPWNTQATTNGPHTVAARARDAAGNLATSSAVSVTVSNTQATGLVAAYGFNEPSGSALLDASGNNNAGSFGTGVSRSASGKFGSALSFAGGFATIPNSASLQLKTAMTLEAWIKPTVVASSWRDLIYKGNDNYYLMATTDFGPRPAGGGTIGGGPLTTEAYATANLVANTWTHVAITYDGAALTMYVNGSAVSTVAKTGTIATSTNPLSIGGDPIWGQTFSGMIDEVRIYNRALSLAEVQTDMNVAVGSGEGSDTVAPTVVVTAPGSGATVSGSVTLTAAASDNVGVAGVQFLVDGAPLGSEVQASPYTTIWNATAIHGSHTIEAVARDAAGNTTRSAAVTVSVNAANADVVGQWAAPFDWPLVSLHAALLHTGEVIGYEYSGAGGPVLWNPTTNQFTIVAESTNKFCSGLAQLPDGRLLVSGGHSDTHVGIQSLRIFDPDARTWFKAPNMTFPRWYPTNTALPDGRQLIMGGETSCNDCNAAIPEVYDPTSNTVTQLSGDAKDLPYYPHMYVLPDGRLFAAANAKYPMASQVLNLATQTWSTVDPTVLPGGSSVMYLPGKIMKSGTSHDPDAPADPSAATTYVIDMNAPSPHWTQTASMAYPRTYHTLTVLPDGNVLVTGGGTTSAATDQSVGVLPAEMWSPTTQTWTTLSSLQISRLYHSIAILLPDGRVLVGAGGRWNGYPPTPGDPSEHPNAEIFSPPYLFKGPQPTITSAPGDGSYGSTIAVATPNAASIASVSLIKLASVTHAFNMDQRFVPLSFTQSGGGLNVTLPANANLAPPGYYMLFIVDSNGVPSTAAMIRMHP